MCIHPPRARRGSALWALAGALALLGAARAQCGGSLFLYAPTLRDAVYITALHCGSTAHAALVTYEL